MERPALAAAGQVVGDVRVGGFVNAYRLAVGCGDHVANLNAERLDGLDADDFVQRGDRGVAVAGMRITGTGTGFIEQWFNTAGGEPTFTKVNTGIYDVTIPGRPLGASDHVAVVTFPGVAPGFATVSHLGEGLRVRTPDVTGSLTDPSSTSSCSTPPAAADSRARPRCTRSHQLSPLLWPAGRSRTVP